jgi:putative ABC transport system permease protein
VFDLENWAEIFSSIRKNKLRTFLTGFAISWGIFMFCILLAAGNGFRNGMMSNFDNQSKHSIQYWGRRTSMPYAGLPENRAVKLDQKDVNLVGNQLPEVDQVSPLLEHYESVTFKQNSNNCNIVGVQPDYQSIASIKIVGDSGRFINELDMRNMRKVAVINESMKKQLVNVPNPVGEKIRIGELTYTVVGVFHESSFGDGSKAYIPYSTAKILYSRQYDDITDVVFTVNNLTTEAKNDTFEIGFRDKLADLHHFDSKDKSAIGIWNRGKNFLQFLGIMNGISAFIWIIGICTLVSGMIGISNIMLITVRERTREIGIRKALGAKSRSILGSILMESVVITFIFGYLGLFLGVGLGELVNQILQSSGASEELSGAFLNPTIQVPVALGALLILLISGFLAGYFPALKAVQISPVEAMRSE